MIKLKKSLFAQLLASVLLVMTAAACVVGAGGIFYLVSSYGILEEDYLSSTVCRNTQYGAIGNVSWYYELKERQKAGEELSYSEQSSLESLEQILGISESSNLVWSLYDDSGKLLETNLADGEDLKKLVAPQDANRMNFSLYGEAVSYTHLTLPTIA